MYRLAVVFVLCGGCSQLVMNPFHGGTLQAGPDNCMASRAPVVVDGVLAVGGAAATVAALATMPSSSPDADVIGQTSVIVGQGMHVALALVAATALVVGIVSASRGARWSSDCRRMQRHRNDPPRDDIELRY